MYTLNTDTFVSRLFYKCNLHADCLNNYVLQ